MVSGSRSEVHAPVVAGLVGTLPILAALGYFGVFSSSPWQLARPEQFAILLGVAVCTASLFVAACRRRGWMRTRGSRLAFLAILSGLPGFLTFVSMSRDVFTIAAGMAGDLTQSPGAVLGSLLVFVFIALVYFTLALVVALGVTVAAGVGVALPLVVLWAVEEN